MQSMFQKWLMQQAIHRYDNMIQLVSFYIFIYIMIIKNVIPVLRELFVVLKWLWTAEIKSNLHIVFYADCNIIQ